jgi:hypothetical protein
MLMQLFLVIRRRIPLMSFPLMKRNLFSLLAGAATLFAASTVFALDQPKFAAPPAAQSSAPAQQPQQKLVKIAHLPTAEANREFQANVQLIQAQRQAAVEMNSALEKEKDPKKKAEIKSQLDQLMVKLNENNEKMVKAYGFSLNRNYVMEVEVADVYLVVSEEEAAQLEKQQKAAAAPAKK